MSTRQRIDFETLADEISDSVELCGEEGIVLIVASGKRIVIRADVETQVAHLHTKHVGRLVFEREINESTLSVIAAVRIISTGIQYNIFRDNDDVWRDEERVIAKAEEIYQLAMQARRGGGIGTRTDAACNEIINIYEENQA